MTDYAALYAEIGYTFGDEALLRLALTHSSTGARNYERLEFLGDAMLDFVVGEYLYRQYADCDEGNLTKMRAHMVSNDVLSALFERWHLDKWLVAYNLSVRNLSVKVRANFVESLLGAVYLDGGIEAARALVHRYICVPDEGSVDYVSALYEFCAATKRRLEVQETSVGSVGNPRFVVAVSVDGEVMGTGEATGIKRAKAQACRAALARLEG